MGIEGKKSHDTTAAEGVRKTVKADTPDTPALKNNSERGCGRSLFLLNTARSREIDGHKNKCEQTKPAHDEEISLHANKILGYSAENGTGTKTEEE